MNILLTSLILAKAVSESDSESGGGISEIPIEFLVGIGVVFLAVFFLVRTLKKVRRSEQKNLRSVAERVDQYRPKLNPVRAQIDELMAELADLARQINGQIDTRLAKLDILQRDAEKTIERLESLLGQGGESTESGLDSVSAFRHPITHKESVNNSEAGADDLRRGAEIPAKPKNYITSDQQTQAVLDMAHQGKSAIAIAQELSRPVGEVELILALNKK